MRAWLQTLLLFGVILAVTGCSEPQSPLQSPAAVLVSTPSIHVTPPPRQPSAVSTATILPATGVPVPTRTTMTSQMQANEQLLRAADNGDLTGTRNALAAGADINVRDAAGRTAVLIATHRNNPDLVRALIEAGADINIRDNRQDNVFLYAGAEGLLEILRLAIAANADPALTNRFGGTALIPAAERGHVEVVRELLTHTKVDVDHINNLGWTALLEAIVLSNGGEKHRQIVQLLVDHDANVAIADKDGVTPLQHARRRGYTAIVGILEAATRARDQKLIEAAAKGDSGAVRHHLAKGADVSGKDGRGQTALIAAAYRNDLVIVDLLIAAGADVNAKDATQQSAYLIATSEGYLELLKRTLQAGADVHSTDSYNGTGLIRAADRGHVEIIAELLKTDIRIDHVNRLGWTALLEAIILGNGGARHTEVVRLLVEAGANVNLADSNGVTPLQHAKQRRFSHIAAILEKAGAR